MVEVAIYGGSFDPISLHHQRVARTVYSILGLPVWFMPCWSHQYGKELASAEERFRMVCIVVEKFEFFQACNHEFTHQLQDSYYATLNELKKHYQNHHFYTIIGTDNANDIAKGKWVESEKLIAENPFIVVERGGCPFVSDWFLKGHHKYLTLGDSGEATAIRKAIQEGNTTFAKENLDPDVWNYIQKQGLYQ